MYDITYMTYTLHSNGKFIIKRCFKKLYPSEKMKQKNNNAANKVKNKIRKVTKYLLYRG